MNRKDFEDRIVVDPEKFGGKPVIRGKRIAVEHILGMLAEGATTDEILEGYPFLENADIQACLEYAYRLSSHEHFEHFISA